METSQKTKKVITIGVMAILIAGGGYFAAQLPTADFYETFYPASRAILEGRSPYDVSGFMSAPWGLIPLLPFALFPAVWAHGLFFMASVCLLIYFAWRMKANVLATTAFMLSPTVIGALLVGNLDAVVLAGVFIPPAWGLLLLMVKPQIGLGVAFYYLVESFRQGKIRKVIQVFTPITLAYLLALVIFPIWFERMINQPENMWNRTMFPYSIPIGLFFLYIAIVRRNVFFAMAATLFIAPYTTFYSYMLVQFALFHEDVEKYIRRDVLQVILCVLLWVVMLVFRL
jgi:hypothetical protein